MNALDFWAANGGVYFDEGPVVWLARYAGTLDDFAAFRAQIEDSFRRHALRKKRRLLTITAEAEDQGFIVYGIAA